MQISPVKMNSFHINKPRIFVAKHSFLKGKNEINFKGVDNACYIDFDINKPKYKYTPIASVKPITKPVGHYDDIDKFAQLFAKKVNSQLLVPTEEDIENLINRIQFKTKASKKQIREVLYSLTAFSSYRVFDDFSKVIDEYGIKQFGLKGALYNSSLTDSITNSAINYLIGNKRFCGYKGDRIALVLDNQTLQMLENLKKSQNKYDNENYEIFIENIKNGNVVFLNLKSWDIKTAQNGHKSANFLMGSGYLEDLAVEVIENLKKGKPEDEIYYSDFKERLFGLIKDDVEKDKIDIVEIDPQIKKENIETTDILDNIKPKTLSEQWIRAVILSYVHFTKKPLEDENKIMPSLLKYLDEQTHVFSIDRLALVLKKLYKRIEEQLEAINEDKDNVLFIVPDERKSFAYITAIYALLNDVDSEKIKGLHIFPIDNQDKTAIILDDISASGKTEIKAICNYRLYWDTNKTKIIYTPVILCASALYASKNSQDKPNGHAYELFLKDMGKINGSMVSEEASHAVEENFNLLDENDLSILLNRMDRGFGGLTLSVMFPYMIPDNCSDLGSLVLKSLLHYENSETNKPFYDFCDYTYAEKAAKMKCEQINEYAQKLISSGKV